MHELEPSRSRWRWGPSEIQPESLPGRKFEARVSRLSWLPQSPGPEQPAYYEAEFQVPNPDLTLKEGMKVRIVLRKAHKWYPMITYSRGDHAWPRAGERVLWEFLRLPCRIYPRIPIGCPLSSPINGTSWTPARVLSSRWAKPSISWPSAHGRPVGRISVHLNHLYDAHYDQITGFFGFFECIPNLQVAAALFEAAAGLAAAAGPDPAPRPLELLHLR